MTKSDPDTFEVNFGKLDELNHLSDSRKEKYIERIMTEALQKQGLISKKETKKAKKKKNK